MALKWNSKILLAKIEGTYGTDSSPAGSDAVLAQNVQLTPMEGEDAPRNLERPWLGADETIPVNVRARLEFDVELAGSGAAGTAPAWGPLMRACGCAQTISSGVSVTYNPVSDNHESVTVHFWIEGSRFVMTGARGSAVLTVAAQAIPRIRFTLTGLYNAPGQVSRATPDFTAWKAPLPGTKANTPTFEVNSVAMVLREFRLDLGNQVEPRLLIGSEAIIIPARAETIGARVEAVALSSFNPFALALARTLVPVEIVHGASAGNIVTLTADACQLRRTASLEQAQGLVEWPLELTPQPVSGNDQWELVLT